MLQLYEARIGIPPQFVGLIGVAFYLTELTGAPIFGALVDRRGWRPFMLLGPLLAAVAVLLTWLTTALTLAVALPLLFVTRLLEGLAVASNTPATLSFLSAASGGDPNLRARTTGSFQIAVIGGTAVGGVLGGLLANQFGVNGFVALAAFYLLCWAVFLRVPGTLPGQPTAQAHPNPLAVLRQPALWAFAPAWIAVNGVLGVWLNNFANQLTLPCAAPPTAQLAALCATTSNQLLVGDYSATSAGLIFAGFAVVFSVGMVLWTRILPHMRPSLAMLLAAGGGLLTCALIALINRQAAAAGLPVLPLLGLVGALLVLSGFTPAALSVLMELAERNASDRGAVMGAYSVLLGVGQFIGGALGGVFAAAAGVDGLIMLTLGFTMIAGLCVLVYRQLEPRPVYLSQKNLQP
jgi:MFS family permease